MYYAYKLLEIENAEREGRNPFKEFFIVRRNRRAAQSAFFVMFMQQFCGVNVRTPDPLISLAISVANSSPGHRILQYIHLRIRRFFRDQRLARIHGHGRNELPLRDPSYLHHRYIRPQEPFAYDLPSYGSVSSLVRIILLSTREPRWHAIPATSWIHRRRNLRLHGRLLPR